MAEPRPCAAQVSDEKPVPRPVTQGGTKRPSQPSQRTTRGHSSARCDVRSQGAPNGSRRGNAIAGSHLARTHLCDAANWRCGVCGAHFQGDLGVAPPARAPARWCRSKQCKCMRRLATAICCVCENTWSNCQCARLAPPADQERRRSQLRLTGYRTGPDAPTSHGKLVEVPAGARSRGVGLSTREVAPGPPRGDPVRAAPSPLVGGDGHEERTMIRGCRRCADDVRRTPAGQPWCATSKAGVKWMSLRTACTEQGRRANGSAGWQRGSAAGLLPTRP